MTLRTFASLDNRRRRKAKTDPGLSGAAEAIYCFGNNILHASKKAYGFISSILASISEAAQNGGSLIAAVPALATNSHQLWLPSHHLYLQSRSYGKVPTLRKLPLPGANGYHYKRGCTTPSCPPHQTGRPLLKGPTLPVCMISAQSAHTPSFPKNAPRVRVSA